MYTEPEKYDFRTEDIYDEKVGLAMAAQQYL